MWLKLLTLCFHNGEQANACQPVAVLVVVPESASGAADATDTYAWIHSVTPVPPSHRTGVLPQH